jgi:dipeptidyl aminopeptidase/acylaminoacyl peptidase
VREFCCRHARNGAAALGLAFLPFALTASASAQPHVRVNSGITWISWAPGSTILFDGAGVQSIRPDGSRLQLLSRRGAHGSWAPDGGWFAVTIGDTGIGVLKVGRPGLSRLTRAGSMPVWSPSGDRIAYRSLTGIRVVRRDGSNDHLAVALRNGQNFTREYDWSPDGRELVFSACLRPVRDGEICPDAVYRAPLARPRERRRVSPGGGTCPDMSSRGAIAYTTSTGLVIRPAGAGPRIAVTRPASCGAWSPDGRLLAVDGKRSLIVARADGTARRRLAVLPPLPTCCDVSRASAPVWSPDSRSIAVARPIEGRETRIAYRLYVVDVATGRARLIVTTPYGSTLPDREQDPHARLLHSRR